MERTNIGILTSGGDCPGLNAVIRAVVKTASKRGWKTLGVRSGFEGLLEPVSCSQLEYKAMDGLLNRGGTILGTTNKGRFVAKAGKGESQAIPRPILEEARANVEKLGMRGLVCVGGDGSLSIAQQLFEVGVPVVGVPKTIDNDLEATVITFGFDSAVACATDALDRLHTTAESHDRLHDPRGHGAPRRLDCRPLGYRRRRRRHPHPRDPLPLRPRRRRHQGARGAGQEVHAGRRRRGGARGRRAGDVRGERRQDARGAARRHRPGRRPQLRSARARRRASSFSATCSAAAARRPSTACSAPASAPAPCSSSPRRSSA